MIGRLRTALARHRVRRLAWRAVAERWPAGLEHVRVLLDASPQESATAHQRLLLAEALAEPLAALAEAAGAERPEDGILLAHHGRLRLYGGALEVDHPLLDLMPVGGAAEATGRTMAHLRLSRIAPGDRTAIAFFLASDHGRWSALSRRLERR